MHSLRSAIGHRLARYLSRPRPSLQSNPTVSAEVLAATLRPGDVLLVEGTARISSAIKYLTQSTWSHAALYVGDAITAPTRDNGRHMLLEADVEDGVRAVPLALYSNHHTRICRPVGLDDAEVATVIDYVATRIGLQYDLRNIFDLARYLLRTPPVPNRYRRRMLQLGSGDPTRAICSSLIAQAFQAIRYPILPHVDAPDGAPCSTPQCYAEELHIRHHSLFAPRDFDISPYFEIVKPSLAQGFDHHRVHWASPAETAEATSGQTFQTTAEKDEFPR